MIIQKIIIYFFLLFSIVFHEYFHALIAYLLGDKSTANRITFNPLPHMNLFGTFLFPLLLLLSNANFLIGWANPVKINIESLKNPKRDIALISLMGPLSNLFLSIVFIIILKILIYFYIINNFWFGILFFAIILNIILFMFNLLPIPPLDGSGIMRFFLSGKYEKVYLRIAPYLFVPILFLFAFGIMNDFFISIMNFIKELL